MALPDEMVWGDDTEIVRVAVDALSGHHPERGGTEREQAAYAVVTAVRPIIERATPTVSPYEIDAAIAPGQLRESRSLLPPVLRVICRYPFDSPEAHPRWVIEHVNQPSHVLEIVDEALLDAYGLLACIPLNVSLEGSR